MLSRTALLVGFSLVAGALAFACSSEKDQPLTDTGEADSGTMDAAVDEKDSGTGNDAGCQEDGGCVGTDQDCVGFGEGAPCIDTGNPYGYVCFGGAPMDECETATESATLGTTYCCPELQCTHIASGDDKCGASAAYFSCPTADGGLLVSPLEGCTASTGEAPYAYFCCPK